MEQYINKSALVAEIKRRKDICKKVIWDLRTQENKDYYQGKVEAYSEMAELIDTLEVKEVDFEKYYHDFLQKEWYGKSQVRTVSEMMAFTAKHFYELGVRVNNPITAADRGTAEEIIVNLKRVEQDYRINLTKEIEWLRNKVKKGEVKIQK